MFIHFLDQVYLQYDVDLNTQSKLFPSSSKHYPLNLGDGWKDQEKIKMLLYLVSYHFHSLCLNNSKVYFEVI